VNVAAHLPGRRWWLKAASGQPPPIVPDGAERLVKG
jgi:hypothetical protein